MNQILIDSPIGPLTLTGTADALTGLAFGDIRTPETSPAAVLEQAAQELAEYFDGQRREFTVPLAPEGTAFQKRVWAELQKIPYGETASYQDIALRLGKSRGAAVAVGQANGRNPLPILIPCHRVIGANGKLVGYTGGMHIKRTLLALEGVLESSGEGR